MVLDEREETVTSESVNGATMSAKKLEFLSAIDLSTASRSSRILSPVTSSVSSKVELTSLHEDSTKLKSFVMPQNGNGISQGEG